MKFFKIVSLIFLGVSFSSLAQESDICKTDPQKCPLNPEKIEFVGSVSFLSESDAQKLWDDIQSHIKGLEALCPLQKKKKVPQVEQWAQKIRQLGDKAGQTYNKNKYSFNRVEIRDGQKKVDLGVTLLDMESILKSEYIKDKTCEELKIGFISGYASHYNMPDSVDVVEALSPWAKKVYSSLTCLCP